MDYYESVVVHYLRADRALFVNTECCIQLNQSKNPDSSGPHWYCDAVACDFRKSRIFLCEISYGAQLSDLTKRLKEWYANWDSLRHALARDSFVPKDWPVRPWLFVPVTRVPLLVNRWAAISGSDKAPKFVPLVTTLEMVQPWCDWPSWNRINEQPKPDVVPEEMRT
jgi:hypothetical protein